MSKINDILKPKSKDDYYKYLSSLNTFDFLMTSQRFKDKKIIKGIFITNKKIPLKKRIIYSLTMPKLTIHYFIFIIFYLLVDAFVTAFPPSNLFPLTFIDYFANFLEYVLYTFIAIMILQIILLFYFNRKNKIN